MPSLYLFYFGKGKISLFCKSIRIGLPADLENLEKPGISLCDLGNLENQGKIFENMENICIFFLTCNFLFNFPFKSENKNCIFQLIQSVGNESKFFTGPLAMAGKVL